MKPHAIAASLAFAAVCLSAQERGTRNVPGTGLISEPGKYVLTAAIPGGFGAAITITASDVSLDLNGQSLTGVGGNRGTGILISNASGVRVTNGSLVNFGFGVVVENSRSVHLEDLQIRGQGLAVASPPPETGIMIVQSRNVVAVNNAIYNTGLGVFVRGGMSWGNRIEGNTIAAGANGAIGICYNPAPGDQRGPRGDLITGNLITGFPTAVQFSETSPANVLQSNTLAYTTAAVDSRNDSNVDAGNTKVRLP
jgi:nitrous oxidase accessory protein NosD